MAARYVGDSEFFLQQFAYSLTLNPSMDLSDIFSPHSLPSTAMLTASDTFRSIPCIFFCFHFFKIVDDSLVFYAYILS